MNAVLAGKLSQSGLGELEIEEAMSSPVGELDFLMRFEEREEMLEGGSVERGDLDRVGTERCE